MDTSELIIQNPITDTVINHVKSSKKMLYIAVPYISSFAKKILARKFIHNIAVKKLVTRFDESNINTFDIPTLQYLLNEGFEILFNNKIHLKLYVTDHDAIITSSNLTAGGFENNIELSVKADSSNVVKCADLFDDLWQLSNKNKITKELLDESLPKYEVLKTKHKFEKSAPVKVSKIEVIESLDVEELIDEILNGKVDYDRKIKLSYKANKNRNNIKNRLVKDSFNKLLFYVSDHEESRKKCLFYDFSYGIESKLAGTGLREAQFKDVFENTKFRKVVAFIYPESIGFEPWNFESDKTLQVFCNGLFEFDIPQYAEAIPIRLASYFYPEIFLPIFKLKDLQIVCETLGIDTNAKSRGERLYAYNSFLRKVMKDVPYNNYVKANMIYKVLYSIILYSRLENGESFDEIQSGYSKKWVRNLISQAKVTLEGINAI
jgi:hypothetical protein